MQLFAREIVAHHFSVPIQVLLRSKNRIYEPKNLSESELPNLIYIGVVSYGPIFKTFTFLQRVETSASLAYLLVLARPSAELRKPTMLQTFLPSLAVGFSEYALG